MDEVYDLLQAINLPESREALQLLSDKVVIHEYYREDLKKTGIRDDLEEIYSKRSESLRKLSTRQGNELADKIDVFLHRKTEGEALHQYHSLTFRNGAAYEFWAFENGWEGWRNYDDISVNDEIEFDRLFDDMLNDSDQEP